MPTDPTMKSSKRSLNQWIFNQMISDEREYNGFSQEEMGRLLGVSDRTISAYEAKKIKPSTDVIFKFLKAFNKKVYVKDRYEEVELFELADKS